MSNIVYKDLETEIKHTFGGNLRVFCLGHSDLQARLRSLADKGCF